MNNKPQLLQAKNVHKSYGQTKALRGANLVVNKGEMVAIMGASGSGKSTLLHSFAGILVPDDGEILLDGQPLNDLSEEQRTELRRTKYGFVFQFGQLIPELTAIENVVLPLLLDGKSRSQAFAIAEPWFAKLGLDRLEQRRSGELSGGQMQRIAIARALAMNPLVLFADEPTGSLDSLSGEKVMELMTKAAKEQGTTVVLVTHDPRIAAYADREVMVRDGIVATGTEGG